jgi:dTDP-4-amino-4,6-dideoxygalactose transaminase
MGGSMEKKTKKTKDSKKTSKPELAIYGGKPLRQTPFPSRFSFGPDEKMMIGELIDFYEKTQTDPGYQGRFEKLYTDAFVHYLRNKGYADAVSSGTAAVFVAIAALRLPKKSKILVSPVTDPGTINAIILNDMVPVLMDSVPGSFNTGVEQLEERIMNDIRAAIIVHIGGKATPIRAMTDRCRECNIKVIEDCSQAHGTRYDNQKVGTFGDIAVFSTMYRKAHTTGGCGGVIYTPDEELIHMVRAFADRGKPYWIENFDDRNPSQFLFPALNFHQNEISCAIGLKSLERLDTTIQKRLQFLRKLYTSLSEASDVCAPSPVSDEDSPFFYTISVKTDKISCTKTDFARAVLAEGISINPHYQYVVSQWPWVRPYLFDDYPCTNAINFRDSSFNLLFNEKFGDQEVRDITDAICKVEDVYRC